MPNSQIFFFRDDIHTYLVLPSAVVLKYVPALKTQLDGSSWIRFGWGDRNYYGAPVQTNLSALRALFIPSTAVIAVMGIHSIGQQISETNRAYSIQCPEHVVEAVAKFIGNYFILCAQDQLILVRQKPDGELFFKARGIYLISNTCNNWTSRGLRIAGLRCLPLINFLPGQVERSVRRNGYLPEP